MFAWWKFSNDLFQANLAAQRVIGLRMLKLAQNGPGAAQEAHRMVAEKVTASMEAALTLAGGGSPEKVVRRYRTLINANEKRLRRSGSKRRR
ncbi:MAG: hypothetical protein JO056_11815 [Alphaproteobacteria bacterium]|nr:hypothetical protein [Alphaproteobacteria bacterium]